MEGRVYQRGVSGSLVFCIKSLDLEEMLNVRESRIHQCKVGIVLDPFKHLRWNFFAKIVFGYKPLLGVHLRGGINKQKLEKWVAVFPNNWYCPLPTIRLHRITLKILDYIFEELFIYT